MRRKKGVAWSAWDASTVICQALRKSELVCKVIIASNAGLFESQSLTRVARKRRRASRGQAWKIRSWAGTGHASNPEAQARHYWGQREPVERAWYGLESGLRPGWHPAAKVNDSHWPNGHEVGQADGLGRLARGTNWWTRRRRRSDAPLSRSRCVRGGRLVRSRASHEQSTHWDQCWRPACGFRCAHDLSRRWWRWARLSDLLVGLQKRVPDRDASRTDCFSRWAGKRHRCLWGTDRQVFLCVCIASAM